MAKPITIRELTGHEANRLFADRRFAKLKPETCSRCGAKSGFTRRIFEIMGVVKRKQADDATQQRIQLYLKQRYAIDFIFFKTHGDRFFADSAVCDGCGSTAVVYDIEFDHDLISEVAKLTGISETQVKIELEKAYTKLTRA